MSLNICYTGRKKTFLHRCVGDTYFFEVEQYIGGGRKWGSFCSPQWTFQEFSACIILPSLLLLHNSILWVVLFFLLGFALIESCLVFRHTICIMFIQRSLTVLYVFEVKGRAVFNKLSTETPQAAAAAAATTAALKSTFNYAVSCCPAMWFFPKSEFPFFSPTVLVGARKMDVPNFLTFFSLVFLTRSDHFINFPFLAPLIGDKTEVRISGK